MSILATIASSGDKYAPGAPTIGTATNNGTGRTFVSGGRADVTFTAPTDTGRSPITSYTVTSNTGGFTGTGAGSPISVTGLTPGNSYTFTVTATNAAGFTSAASSASNSITATTIPAVPTIGTATAASSTSVSVAFTAGGTGGLSVTYNATGTPGGSGSNSASPITVSGLTTGTNYTFTVTATNSNGTSAASSASNSVAPNYTGVSAWTSATAYPNYNQYPLATTQGTSNFAWFGTGAVDGGAGGSTNQGYYWGGSSWTNSSATFSTYVPGQARWDKDNGLIQGGYVFNSDFYQTNGSYFVGNTPTSFLNGLSPGKLGWAIGKVSNGMIFCYGEASSSATTYYKTTLTGTYTAGTNLPAANGSSGFGLEDGTFSYSTFYSSGQTPLRSTAVGAAWTTVSASPFGNSLMYYSVANGGSTGTTGINIVGVRDNGGTYVYNAAANTFTATTATPQTGGNSFSFGTYNSNTRVEYVDSKYYASGSRLHYYATLT
jgi:hypothetical protein